MEMKKSSRRAGIAIAVAGLIVGLMPSVANAATSGWLDNHPYWSGTTAGVNWTSTINETQRVQVSENGAAPGDIGCRVLMGGSVTGILWGATVSGWSSQTLAIEAFQVVHY